MAEVIRSIRASGGDYSTPDLWRDDLDNGAVYSAADDAIGELYNEQYSRTASLNINTGGTIGLASITLRAASGEEHDGTAGSGARFVKTAATTFELLEVTTEIPQLIQNVEFDANGNPSGDEEPIVLNHSRGGTTLHRLLVHGASHNFGAVTGIGTSNDDYDVLNCFVWDIESTATGGAIAAGIDYLGGSARVHNIMNCTVYGITNTNGTGDAQGYYNLVESANHRVSNCISIGAGGTSTGAKTAFAYQGTGTTADNNMSDDASADDAGGTGHVISVSAGTQFVSTTAGMEDLHLVAGSDAVGAGQDFGTSPTWVNIDIDGDDRESAATWDIGADQYIAPASGGGRRSPLGGPFVGALGGPIVSLRGPTS